MTQLVTFEESAFFILLDTGEKEGLYQAMEEFTFMLVQFVHENNSFVDKHAVLAIINIRLARKARQYHENHEVYLLIAEALSIVESMKKLVCEMQTNRTIPVANLDTPPPMEVLTTNIRWTKGPFKLIELILALYLDESFEKAQLNEICRDFCIAFHVEITEKQLNNYINKIINRSNEDDEYALYLAHLRQLINTHAVRRLKEGASYKK